MYPDPLVRGWALDTDSTIFVGLDVHPDTVTVAVLPEHAKEVEWVKTYPNNYGKLRRAFKRIERHGTIRACYEASGAGYVFQRELTRWGIACEVIAPGLIPVRPGEQHWPQALQG